ncbi:hypothetical protein [Burkholderia gladioli]|uniref:hypothetical protein n=1 Tax=Burkholderia gladioli TaxID=28095 RepID=UPI001917092F|nr:hypothetical protein [Burkholderia gladioli]
MILPTVVNASPPPNKLVDNSKVPVAIVFPDKDGNYRILVFVGNEPHWLIWTAELELWLSISGVKIVHVGSEPDIQCDPENVDNVPSDLPKPKPKSGWKV